jgi:nicotinamidase-related amidase
MAENTLSIDRNSTALILIDLQKGIVGRDTSPYKASDVVANAVRLVKKFRENNMPIFFVHVDFKNAMPLMVESDSSIGRGNPPADWTEFVDDLGVTENDMIVTKRQWGAFYGTDLEQQLRRRKINTIVLGGIATTYGVESTARFAYEYGFNQIFPEDAMTDLSEESHKVSVEYVLKRMGKVRKTEEVLSSI